MNYLASDEVVPPPRAFGLPCDVLALISDRCSRQSLLSLCLVNKVLHTIATTRLYRDPVRLIHDQFRNSGKERWPKLCRVLLENAGLADRVRSFSNPPWSDKKRPDVGRQVPSRLKNLTAVEWQNTALRSSIDHFIETCPSSSIRSIRLPNYVMGVLEQPFWTWLEKQTKVKELALPWNCKPISLNLSLLASSKLEKLAASPEVTMMLLPVLKSIRSFCGLSISDYSKAPVWGIEVLGQVLQQFGEGLKSIRGVKVQGQDIIHLLRLLHTWCPFVKTVHFNIDPRSVGSDSASTNCDSVVAALCGFLYLEELSLSVNCGARDKKKEIAITGIVQGCPKLRLFEWRSITWSTDDARAVSQIALKRSLLDGSWSRL
ncbi:hypothetical protein FRB94_012012 [Tulasnella sp. JGI-2019a]|nr:hypothetical protein FRB94_012012 [Tulasnella sp. JGI-2019a]